MTRGDLGHAIGWQKKALEAAPPAKRESLTATLRETPVDVDRVYLTGLSMGGYGSWELAVRWPDVFAALIPICGGGDAHRVHRVLSVPICVYHGADDPVVPARESRAMIPISLTYPRAEIASRNRLSETTKSWMTAI